MKKRRETLGRKIVKNKNEIDEKLKKWKYKRRKKR